MNSLPLSSLGNRLLSSYLASNYSKTTTSQNSFTPEDDFLTVESTNFIMFLFNLFHVHFKHISSKIKLIINFDLKKLKYMIHFRLLKMCLKYTWNRFNKNIIKFVKYVIFLVTRVVFLCCLLDEVFLCVCM